MGEAMKAVGYSETYSENPAHLKETDAWKLLMSQEVKDEKLVEVLNFLLDHKEWRAKDAGLDKALKIKNKYAPEKHHITVGTRPLAEIEDEISATLSEAIEALSGEG